MHMHVWVFWQLIGGEGSSCICMCVFWQLIGDKVVHAYIHVCVYWQLIGEKVAHAYACVCCGI